MEVPLFWETTMSLSPVSRADESRDGCGMAGAGRVLLVAVAKSCPYRLSLPLILDIIGLRL